MTMLVERDRVGAAATVLRPQPRAGGLVPALDELGGASKIAGPDIAGARRWDNAQIDVVEVLVDVA